MATNPLSMLVGLQTKLKEYEVRPADFMMDSDETGSDAGSALTIMESINFEPAVAGAVWVSVPFLSGWRDDADVSVELEYTLLGAGAVGNVVGMTMQSWAINEGKIPVEITPDGTSSADLAYDAGINQDKIHIETPAGLIIPNSILTSGTTKSIRIKFIRSASDTYGGTLQLLRCKFYQ